MSDIEVKAPANIKISGEHAGEHAVAYGGSSLSAAIDIYATAKVTESSDPNRLDISLPDLNESTSLDYKTLQVLYENYSKRNTKDSADLIRYVEKFSDEIGKDMLAYATIAARLLFEHKVNPMGKMVMIHSDVPVQKGFASSSICPAVFGIGLIKSSGKKLKDSDAIDIIRDGDRVIHKLETAGRIDVGPAYYGGYAIFSATDGVKKVDVITPLKVVIFDVGPKPPTSEMVAKVRELYKTRPESTTKILKDIDNCVEECINALKEGNLKKLGIQMAINHSLLRELGVSSKLLDKAVQTALLNEALGAKMCGGGGGGMGIALVKDDSDAAKVISALKQNGFDAYTASISLKGAKDYLKPGNRIKV